jgi:hypothetical protein
MMQLAHSDPVYRFGIFAFYPAYVLAPHWLVVCIGQNDERVFSSFGFVF